MERLFITNLTIKKVRHLQNISIPLSDKQIKHLFITGKNGSGKTSVIEALAEYLNNVFTDQYFEDRERWLYNAEKEKDKAIRNKKSEAEILRLDSEVLSKAKVLNKSRSGLDIKFSNEIKNIFILSEKYHYILAYYRADRIFKAEQPKHVEKVQLKDYYELNEFPRDEFVKYLLDLKMTEALARSNKISSTSIFGRRGKKSDWKV